MAIDPSQLPDAQVQLAAANAELVTLRKEREESQQAVSKAQLGEARARALKDFGSTIDDDVLNFYHGDPTGLYDYAKSLNDKIAARVAAPPAAAPGAAAAPSLQTPAPAPGPGSNIPPESARKLEIESFRAKAMDKDIDMGGRLGPNGSVSSTRGGSEARKYYEMALGEGLREHLGKAKR